ncbi:helix-turn-helix domain-containing protein [Pedobacter caeni]|uniref:HTH-type transcriptional regulator / antitoxin HigA n=1 Tax=Pedobacter caeni TaxID=288992 RepID=A0A1M4ZQG9_9SPHI|nr:helix-turn-helix domain-containing protein [Pedobacter caeni]SHF20289.1 HTH-type transcriptional regulator / antitoxin HigA [Pedobacter caeni]
MRTYKVLKTETEYKEALDRTISIFHAEPDAPEFQELELLLVLVKDYEDKNIVIPTLKAIEVVKLKMEERGLKAKDLEPIIGSKGHVSLVLSGKRELTLKMARALRTFLGIPPEVFLPEMG